MRAETETDATSEAREAEREGERVESHFYALTPRPASPTHTRRNAGTRTTEQYPVPPFTPRHRRHCTPSPFASQRRLRAQNCPYAALGRRANSKRTLRPNPLQTCALTDRLARHPEVPEAKQSCVKQRLEREPIVSLHCCTKTVAADCKVMRVKPGHSPVLKLAPLSERIRGARLYNSRMCTRERS